MSKITVIKINFDPFGRKTLSIPETIEAPQYSIIQWNIVGLAKLNNHESIYSNRRISFILYFENRTPFNWREKTISNYYSNFPSRIIKLAEDTATEKGEYKYGVKIIDSESKKTLFDEDPLIIIY